MSDFEEKYFTTFDYNKLFTKDAIDVKIKQKELVNKSGTCNLAKNSDLDKNIESLATKAELKAQQDEVVTLETNDFSYFLSKNIFTEDCSQNMFVYQPTFRTLQIKKIKALIIFLVGNQKAYIVLFFFHNILFFFA